MSLLTPIGFLGLLGLIVLILIYIIKPNYQQKVISSTFVWKLSLKYRKKNIPINKFRNIILFICQVLIISTCAFLLAQPVIAALVEEKPSEKIIIIDASASMRVETNEETRFERAIIETLTTCEEVFDLGGKVSVIIANNDPYFVAQRSSADDFKDIEEELDLILKDANGKAEYEKDTLIYGSADMQKAVDLTNDILVENPDAKVYVVTGTQYVDVGEATLIDVSLADEWNAAVLNVSTTTIDNFFEVTVDVGCYGKAMDITVAIDVVAYNGNYAEERKFEKEIRFDYLTEQSVVFTVEETGLYAFDQLYVHLVDVDDNFTEDNYFYQYGGITQSLNIQYISELGGSPMQNPFFDTVLQTLSTQFASDYNINITRPRDPEIYAKEEYDIYVYEHYLPERMPADGVVIIMDPPAKASPKGLDIAFGDKYTLNATNANMGLDLVEEHPVTKFTNLNEVYISSWTSIARSDGYVELASFMNDYPTVLVKNEADLKVLVLSFDVHMSNVTVRDDFAIMIYNAFKYFFPVTLSGGYAYQVGDTVNIDARGSDLTLNGPQIKNQTFETIPASLNVTLPGTYTLMQGLINGNMLTEYFFVRIPSSESNIAKQVEDFPEIYAEKKEEIADKDLLVYFIIIAIALLFIEWWLQSHEYF